MKTLLLIILFAIVTVPTMKHSVAENDVQIDQEFRLRVGQEVSLRDTKLKIKFVSVVEDSRCPTGVDCIWHGNGKVQIDIKKSNRKPMSLTLNTYMAPQESAYGNYIVKLLQLSPYPASGKTISPDQYEATLIISTAKKDK